MKLILRLDTVRGKGKHPLSLFLCIDDCKVGRSTNNEKTSIAAVMVKLLVKEYPNKKIHAIDADPAVGLDSICKKQ